MGETLVIGARFNGPAGSGNGGYSAGSVAELLPHDGLDHTPAAVVTLRRPPPLDTPLTVERSGPTVTVYQPDGALVAEAAPAEPDVEPVPPVSFVDADTASQSFTGFVAHPFPTCFVCGPERAAGDGLRLFPGRLDDGRTATAWTVPDDVSAAMVWGALDCPGGWAIGVETRPYVLGRLTTRVTRVPAPGEQCVVMGRLLTVDGRKANVSTTLYGADGHELARAAATWIAIA